MPEILDIGLSLLTLTILEVVLGIDNLVFLAIVSQKLPSKQQKRARQLGLTFAWVTRVILLASAVWLTKLTKPLVGMLGFTFSGRDLFLILGGVFLLFKATQEIHNEIEPHSNTNSPVKIKLKQFWIVVSQIAVLDIVFSLDSVLTAIGLTDRYWLMVIAITIAIITMIFASEPLSKFIERHPTVKMLALSFLILIGMVLIADGFQYHIPRGYIYFSMSFSLLVESLNMWRTKKRTPKRASR
jgi:predicted tellurium resistance membrane protein TerC